MMRMFRSKVGLVLALLADVLLYAGGHQTRFGVPIGELDAAFAAQAVADQRWIDLEGVVGTAIGIDGSGRVVVKIFLSAPGIVALPAALDGVSLVAEVTGPITALPAAEATDPKRSFPRPVPIGVSGGHPSVTAGTIGARVSDGDRVFALSNNHVFAAVNKGRPGDNLLQPGTVDGGRDPDDAMGTLADFEPIRLCQAFACPENRIDAALALTTREALGASTPDGGYGAPRSRTAAAELGAAVQKYGRTTGQTVGRITGIHATIDVGYPGGNARFVDQIVISDGSFGGPGDSGSLIVTKGTLLGDRRPVALLFAGSNTNTIANPIDPVLLRFGVTIEGAGR